jgi:hypothetical protein
VLQCITEHQSPLAHFELQSVAGVLSGAVVSEGGSHWIESYERIIEAQRRLRAPLCASYQTASAPAGISTGSGATVSSNSCIS